MRGVPVRVRLVFLRPCGGHIVIRFISHRDTYKLCSSRCYLVVNKHSVTLLYQYKTVALVHKYQHMRILGAGSYQVHTT